jgi:hypothetical protein
MSKNAFAPGGKAYERRKADNKRRGPRREIPASEQSDDWRKKKQDDEDDSDEQGSGSEEESGSDEVRPINYLLCTYFYSKYFPLPCYFQNYFNTK